MRLLFHLALHFDFVIVLPNVLSFLGAALFCVPKLLSLSMLLSNCPIPFLYMLFSRFALLPFCPTLLCSVLHLACRGSALRASKPTFYDFSRTHLRTSGEEVANNLFPDVVRPHVNAFQPQDWPPKAANLGAERHANPVLQRPEGSCSQRVRHFFVTGPG